MVSRQSDLIPILSNDPSDKIIRNMKRFDRGFSYGKLKMYEDYPILDDYEALLHYFRGAAGRIIDLLQYVDFGVGFKLKAKDFKSEEEGIEATEEVMKDMKKRQFDKTIFRAGAFYEVLGRCCIVETYALDDTFYYNETEKITGYDAINPMTLDNTSIRNALSDITGTEEFIQYGVGAKDRENVVSFEQDRVIYLTKNPLTDQSPYGNSNLQKCVNDLRTLAGFAGHRDKLARLYSEMFSVVTINTEKIGANELTAQITSSTEAAQDYLDETAEFYRDQMKKGSVMAVYDWEEFDGKSWAGKEVKLQDLEIASLDAVCYKLGVPMPMLRYANLVNRDTLPALVDTFIKERERGNRKFFYTPLIEGYCEKILNQLGYTEGYFEVEYNPFLSKDYLALSQIIANLYPTGAITNPEIRDLMDWDNEMNMGGDEWDEEKVMPNQATPTINIQQPPVAAQAPVDNRMNKPVEQETVQASLDLYKEVRTNPYYDLFY
ncbi:MAG: hypothetical protein QHH15_00295 [Candidatus Thermoplasmatota archaeon]|nr:hypothetical protein [Candidatus Thermoplasmatota archaeon]